MSRVDIGASRRSRGRRRKFASGKHDRHVDHRTVQDGFVHVSNGGLGVRLVDVEDIRGAAIRVELSIHRHVQVSDRTILAKDLVQVFFIDSLGQLLDHDLSTSSQRTLTPTPVISPMTWTPTFTTKPAIATRDRSWRPGRRVAAACR